MYTLKEIETNELYYLELVSSNGESTAQICLNQGGRLSDFSFENTQIVKEFDSSTYKDNYASAILFPFANRIKDGEYTFKDSKHKLNCNETDKNNAIHGLVYNKTFVLIKKKLTSDFASVSLQYKNYGKDKGFPFKFHIELTYTLSKNGITLAIKVKNKDKKTFPFSIGWHPYFYSTNLNGTETSTGERFYNSKYTAACNLFKLNTIVRVTNLRNGKTVLVRINDHMHPNMLSKGRVIDLSQSAAKQLVFKSKGLVKVMVDAIGYSKKNPKSDEK